MSVPICADVPLLREHVAAWRLGGERVALVPTMGALHDGHMKLVEMARRGADRVVVSVFVNPKQFGPSEDYGAYPRDLERDCRTIEAAGGDLVYAPSAAVMYPRGFATTVSVEGPASVGLEDKFRPSHFAGVTTVVAKLLMQAQPDVALFGRKDYQQLKVIERMVADLDLPIEIVPVYIVRDRDGLALSSRNAYLDSGERARAPALYEALKASARAIEQGAPVAASVAAARRAMDAAGFAIDYVEARRADDLLPLKDRDGAAGRLLAAARLGRTRLIDNVGIVERDASPRGEKAQG